MAVNLSRNTKVFFTTFNADNLATDTLAGHTPANTFEIQVLAGYSFTQNTEQQTITLSEAGTAPVRGERSFNSKLNPVDWSLSTYIRPYLDTNIQAPEKYLWNALLGTKPVFTGAALACTSATVGGNTTDGFTLLVVPTVAHTVVVGDSVQLSGITGVTGGSTGNGIFRVTAITGTTNFTVDLDTKVTTTGPAGGTITYKTGQWYESASSAIVTAQGSNKNALQNFALIFQVDNVYYKVYNCAANQADIQFDLQGIAMIAWSGFGTQVLQSTTITPSTPLVAGTGTTPGCFLTSPPLATKYITNKLSTTTLMANIGGTGTGNTTYTVPITGGNITINNNIEYVTPENLGVVNRSIGYFTGTRSISGSLNAYLKTGAANESGKLLSDILAGLVTTSETKFKLQIEVGGASNATRVELLMNAAQLGVPTIDIQDVVSTAITFNAQGYSAVGLAADPGSYEISKTNNLVVTYYGV
jgi:hypothetical protein